MAQDRGLKLVLDQRKKAEDQAQKAWAQGVQAVSVCEAQLQKLASFKQVYLNEMAQKSAGVTNMTSYLAYQEFIAKLERIAERQEKVLDGLRQRADELRGKYLKTRQDRQIIESLLEKHRKERQAAEARAEAKLTDDVVSSKMARAAIERSRA